ADRQTRAPFLPVLTPLEDHFEGDDEEEQAAGDAEGRQRDAEDGEDVVARDREERQHDEGDGAGPERDLRPLRAVHARRHGQKQRSEPRRINRDEDGHEGIEQAFDTGQLSLRRWRQPCSAANPTSPMGARKAGAGRTRQAPFSPPAPQLPTAFLRHFPIRPYPVDLKWNLARQISVVALENRNCFLYKKHSDSTHLT